jgi:hypothetical protein
LQQVVRAGPAAAIDRIEHQSGGEPDQSDQDDVPGRDPDTVGAPDDPPGRIAERGMSGDHREGTPPDEPDREQHRRADIRRVPLHHEPQASRTGEQQTEGRARAAQRGCTPDADRAQPGTDDEDHGRRAVVRNERSRGRGEHQPEHHEPQRGRLHPDDPRTPDVFAPQGAHRRQAADRRVHTDPILDSDAYVPFVRNDSLKGTGPCLTNGQDHRWEPWANAAGSWRCARSRSSR